jgi:glycosyltransferase involved in cell wall biosynthesis
VHVVLIVPGGVDRSGETRVIPALLWLIERLAEQHRVTVVALGQEPADSRYSLLGATVLNVRVPQPGGSRVLAPLRLVALLRRAVRAVGREGRPDVVHGFWASVSGLVAGLAGRRYRVPSLVSAAGGELVAMPDIGYGGALGRGGRLIGSWSLRLADDVTVSSDWMAEHVRRAGHAVDGVVPLGVDTSMFSPGSETERSPHHLVHVASRNRVKDPFLLVDAFGLVRASIPDATLELVGVDTLDGAVERHVEAAGLGSNVTITGFVRPSDLPAHYRKASMHVLTSWHDAAPVAVLEAAACAVPTVGTKVGHVTDLAASSPPAAVVVDSRDPAILATAIVALLQDEARRRSLGEAALAWATAHDADHTARAFLDRYVALLATRRPRSWSTSAAASGELPLRNT